MLAEAREAWLEAVERYPGNPSSLHRVGERADKALGDARERLAVWLGCHPLDIIFTSGATESANLVVHHAAKAYSDTSSVWHSAIEHPCVGQAVRSRFPKRNVPLRPRENGRIEGSQIEEAFRHRRPALLAVMAGNNETGIVQPWNEIGEVCREHGVDYFCDATQWLGKLPATGLGICDYVSGSAHKFGGPRGVGFLKVKRGGSFEPLFRGGLQEEGRRAGTENVAGVLSMIKALEIRERDLEASGQVHRQGWRDRFLARLKAALPGVAVVGETVERIWNTAAVVMPAKDCRQRLAVKLDKAGFAVATGSACASGREEASPVLIAMGYSPEDAARMLRFSSGWETTESDWEALLAGLIRVASGE